MDQRFSKRLELLIEIVENFVGRQRRKRLAQIAVDSSSVVAWVQSRQNALAVRTNPYPHIERGTFRRFFQGFRASTGGRRSPYEFLRRKSFHAGVRQNCRQRRGKSETIGQHVFGAGLTQFFAEPIIAIKNLADDASSAGRVYVSFFHRRPGGKPSAF